MPITGIQTYANNVTLSITLTGLANGATAVSSAYDNTTTGYLTMDVQFSITGNENTITTNNTPYVDIYILVSVDGGVTYDDSNVENAELLRTQWAELSNQQIGSVLIEPVPQFFKFMVYNRSGTNICLAQPKSITAGGDGNLWLPDGHEQRIWEVTTAGVPSTYQPPATLPNIGTNTPNICQASDGSLRFTDYLNFFVWNSTISGVLNNGVFGDPIVPEPKGICSGPDGNLWVVDRLGYVYKVTTAGVITPYFISSGFSSSYIAICAGPDGNLWIADASGFAKLLKVSTAGSILATYSLSSGASSICSGPDGNLWVGEFGQVEQVTTGGVVTTFVTAGASSHVGICDGGDGNLWTAESTSVWQITTAGVPTEYVIGTAFSLSDICLGPDTNLWASDAVFTVHKVTTAGVPTSYTITGSNLQGICDGGDGNLWAADPNGKVWKITTGGVGTSYPLSGTPTPEPQKIALGADGNLWIGDQRNHVFEVTTAGSPTSYSIISGGPLPQAVVNNGTRIWMADNAGYVWKMFNSGTTELYVNLPSSSPLAICVGPDSIFGAFYNWVADGNGDVWQIRTSSFLSVIATLFPIGGGVFNGICNGGDGNLWVSDASAAVWKITTGGVGTSYALVGATPTGICLGPDTNLWVSDSTGKVWKVTTGGVPTSYTLTGSDPRGICNGGDGNLWVADFNGYVWKVTTGGVGTKYDLCVDNIITFSGKNDFYF